MGLATAYDVRGQVLLEIDSQNPEILTDLEQAATRLGALTRQDPRVLEYQLRMATATCHFANAMAIDGQQPQAAGLYEETIATLRELRDHESLRIAAETALVLTLMRFAEWNARAGNPQAEELYSEAKDIWRQVVARDCTVGDAIAWVTFLSRDPAKFLLPGESLSGIAEQLMTKFPESAALASRCAMVCAVHGHGASADRFCKLAVERRGGEIDEDYWTQSLLEGQRGEIEASERSQEKAREWTKLHRPDNRDVTEIVSLAKQ